MSQKFIQGKINHLTWVMVDATDFATPESALSAATKIKIYGTLNGNSTAAFLVSSGTGSLTKDIQHVGASALGIYTIPLATADLSDASAAFYDTYIVSLSATGAAYQTIIVPGERTDTSRISNVLSYLSDIVSNVNSQLIAGTFALGASNLSDISSRVASDLESRLGYTLSDFGSKVNAIQNSRLSGMSDILSKVYVQTTGMSDILSNTHADLANLSDIVSNINSLLIAGTFALGASNLSDISSRVSSDLESRLGYTLSDFGSKVNAIQNSRLSGMSDILSKVYVQTTGMSDILSNTHADLATLSGVTSDIYSLLSSRVTKAVATKSMVSGMSDILSKVYVDTTDISDVLSNTHADLVNLSDIVSNINSLLIAGTFALGASNLSDISSRVSSDLESRLGTTLSDLGSKIGAMVEAVGDEVWSEFGSLTGSTLSDMMSTLAAGGGGATTSAIADKVWSDFASKVGSSISDMMSTLAAGGGGATTSAIAAKVWSDFGSQAAMTPSDLGSKMGKLASRITKPVATASMLTGISDILSNVHGDVADLSNILSNTHADLATLSDIVSNINSQLIAGTFILGASNLSDISSRVASDLESRLGYTLSDFGSKVNAIQNSRLSGMSDILSKVYVQTTGMSDILSNTHADLATLSGVTSDIYSLLSSRVTKAVATKSMVSGMSDILSKVYVDTTDISDVLSNTHADLADLSNILSNTHADLATLSGVTSDIYSLLSSRVTKAVATKSMVSGMSDILSKIYADTTDISDVLSNVNARVPAALVGGRMAAYIGASAWSVTAAATAGCTTTSIISDTAGLDATDDHYNGRIIIFTSGNLKDQATDITNYEGATKTFTVTALTEAPADDDTFVIL